GSPARRVALLRCPAGWPSGRHPILAGEFGMAPAEPARTTGNLGHRLLTMWRSASAHPYRGRDGDTPLTATPDGQVPPGSRPRNSATTSGTDGEAGGPGQEVSVRRAANGEPGP